MTNLSPAELDEWMRKNIPILYQGNGVTVGVDLEIKSWYFYTTKYRIDWFWADHRFQVFKQVYNGDAHIFSAPIHGDLSTLCYVDDGVVLYCDAETVDAFVERLLGLRVFE